MATYLFKTQTPGAPINVRRGDGSAVATGTTDSNGIYSADLTTGQSYVGNYGSPPYGWVGGERQLYDTAGAPTSAPMARTLTALGLANTVPFSLQGFGDSTVEGAGATKLEYAWLHQLRALLQANFTSAGKGGFGLLPTYSKTGTGSPNADLNGSTSGANYWTFTGGTAGAMQSGQPLGLVGTRMRAMGVGEVATLTFVGTGADLHHSQGSAASKPFTVTVDGGSATTVTPTTTGGANKRGKYQIRGLTSGTHTVVLTPVTAGTDALPILAAYLYDGDESNGIHTVNHGIYGASTVAIANTNGAAGASYLADPFALFGPPTLSVIMAGLNNPTNAVSPAQTTADLQTMIATQKAAGTQNFLLFSPYTSNTNAGLTPTWPNYTTAIKAVETADPASVKVIDLQQAIPQVPTAANAYSFGLIRSDQLHLENAGDALLARLAYQAITGQIAA